MTESNRKDYEPIDALWASLAFDSQMLGLSEAADDMIHGLFLQLLKDFPLDVLETVTSPALGAGKSIAGFRVRRAFKRDFAAFASKLAVCVGHDHAPCDLNDGARAY